MMRVPELNTALQVGTHKNGAEEQNPLPQAAGHASLDADQDTVGLLDHELMLGQSVLI